MIITVQHKSYEVKIEDHLLWVLFLISSKRLEYAVSWEVK
jgi:hypothetical protein